MGVVFGIMSVDVFGLFYKFLSHTYVMIRLTPYTVKCFIIIIISISLYSSLRQYNDSVSAMTT